MQPQDWARCDLISPGGPCHHHHRPDVRERQAEQEAPSTLATTWGSHSCQLRDVSGLGDLDMGVLGGVLGLCSQLREGCIPFKAVPSSTGPPGKAGPSSHGPWGSW